MNITLPIFWNNDDTKLLEDVGMDDEISMDDYDIRMLTFYSISVIWPYEKGKYTALRSDGETFVCSKSFKETKQLIDENKYLYNSNR